MLVLVYTSFLIKANHYDKPEFQEIKKWEIAFDINSWKIIKEKNWNLKANYINNSDKILSYSSNLEIIKEEKNTKIKLEKGVFLININSINNKYLVESEGFNLELSWANTVFIDTTWQRAEIFSVDNILKLNFFNTKNWELLNTAYIYPNQYIFFDPTKNFLIKNADLLRITQLLSLWYFNENILTKDWKVNENFKKIFLSKEKNINSQTEKLFLYLYFDHLEKKNDLENFKKMKFSSIPWESLMLEYWFLLMNSNKKAIYLKNQVLKTLQETLKSPEKEELLEKNKITIENFLKELKEINEKDFNEIKEMISYFLANISSTQKENKELKLFFLKLLNPEFQDLEKTSAAILSSAFYNYNLWKETNFYSEIKKFVDQKDKEEFESREKDFFIFFLDKIIIANLKAENTNFKDTISIFKTYTEAWIDYYQASDEKDKTLKNKIIETWIVNFSEIVKKILEKTEKYFFKRSEKWLLVNIPWRELDRESISSLKTSIENIYNNFYTPNQWVLTTTNASVKVVYRRNFEKFEEVITALWDTEKYLTKYDKKLSDILTTEEKEDNSKTLSIEDAKEFLSKFDHIKFDDSNIEIMWREYCDNPNSKEAEKNKKNPTCYRIKNMEVWNWTKISFLLFPYEYHKISDISIWWNKNLNKWSYKMDDEEEKYKEQENNFSDPSEKEQYKFKNFFINVITASQSWKKQQVEDYVEDNRSQESEIIRTIKNTNLLWKNWTLTKLKPILDVAYNDIKITETESDLIININNAKVNYSSEKKNYFWRFKSEYKYKSGKINSFVNPEIQITNDNWENVISWTSIKLSWLIKLDDFKKIMDSFFKNMSSIIDAVTYVSQNDSSEDLRITYLPQIDKFQIISKNIKIFIIWDEIELFSSFWKKILEKNEKISKIRWLLEYK